MTFTKTDWQPPIKEDWHGLAIKLGLKERRNGWYRGDCFNCEMPRILGINVEKGYMFCLLCTKTCQGYNFQEALKFIKKTMLEKYDYQFNL